jgi:hypothetical protein
MATAEQAASLHVVDAESERDTRRLDLFNCRQCRRRATLAVQAAEAAAMRKSWVSPSTQKVV